MYEVAIIGAGPGGIAAGHLLRKKGITDFVILGKFREISCKS
jgi:cation diffusion facilitator CzcD-associated flavoprotein CzcO